MSILFGHPGGSPFSYHAALAHFAAGRLEAFCVPWLPSALTLRILASIPPITRFAARLTRRSFPALAGAPTIQGRLGEMRRLVIRATGRGDEGLSYDANDWLMKTMKRACHNPRVTAVHSYEDCSLWQFEEAKRLGKACIYDMPIGYYPWWETRQAELARRYAEWLPPGGLRSNRFVRPQQKRGEMDLADLVLAPSAFVERTIREFHPDKTIVLAPYGVDLEFWRPKTERAPRHDRFRFIFAGQISIRKGVPTLLESWRKADLKDAELRLVGSWQLSESRKAALPPGVTACAALSREALREEFNEADVLVFPTFFEGRALVVAEALACGLPVVTTEASGLTDVVDGTCGRVISPGVEDELAEALRWFTMNRTKLPEMSGAARAKAEVCTWDRYRRVVSEGVAPFLS